MANLFHQKFAQTVVQYSLNLQPGDILLIRTTTLAVPLVQEVYREALRAGANVITRLTFDRAEEIFAEEASDEQLQWISEGDIQDAQSITARLVISAPFNTRAGKTISNDRMALRAKVMQSVGAIQSKRTMQNEMRWCGTLFPTHALAQEAEMNLPEYEQFVYRAMFLDRDDPIAAWKEFSVDQQKKVDQLNQVGELRFIAEDTDFKCNVAGRKWMNSDGKRNFPSGEVFTGPIEDSASGHVRFSFPSLRNGKEISDVRLKFDKGRVVSATAASNQVALLAELDYDDGARLLGEIAIGNNYGVQRYTRNTLFDEKIGGTFHMAVGSSYPETGGVNTSSIHWDLVCDLRSGGEIYADNKLIHKDGQWVI